MALAALFAKSSIGPDDAIEDSEPTASTRANSTLAFAGVESFSDKVLDALPKEKRKALTTAKLTQGYEHQQEKSSGPAHFRLAKTGLGRAFDVVLGDPCTCVVAPHPSSTNRHTGGLRSGTAACDDATTLLLIYFVLVRVLSVEIADPALLDVPHLSERTVSRLLDGALLAKRRALRHDHRRQRRAYEEDVSFEPGELAGGGVVDFERTLGGTEESGGSVRVHPRARLFGGLPPVVLGAGNVAAAAAARSNAMVSVDTVGQVEHLWRSTVQHRRRRPREGEAYGQSTVPHRLASTSLGYSQSGQARGHGPAGADDGGSDVKPGAAAESDPYWSAAAALSGSASFPWRRELHMCERVALLSQHDSSLDGAVEGAGEVAVLSPVREMMVQQQATMATKSASARGGRLADARSGGSGGGGGRRSRASSSPNIFGTPVQPGFDVTGAPLDRMSRIPQFPFATAGGRVVVDSGTVLPPGMGVRHPALARAAKFQSSVIEFLLLWASAPAGSHRKLALGQKVDALWLQHSKFRAWSRSVYARNKKRANFMRANPIRITVVVPDGRAVQVKVSALATGVDLKALLEEKLNGSASGSKGARRNRYRFVGKGSGQQQRGGSERGGAGTTELLFEGVPVDDRVSLSFVGVRTRSTLTIAHVPAQMMRGDDGLPVY